MSNKLADKVKDIKPENIVKGFETILSTLPDELTEQVDDLTTKELRRTLKSVIKFVATAQDDRSLADLRKKEVDFLGGMIYLVDTSRHYHLHIVSELQKERAEESAQGETNE